MKDPVYVAVDIGATGIKLAAAAWKDEKLEVKDIYAVKNAPLVEAGGEYADIAYMLRVIREGLERFSEKYSCVSVGIDTYGNGYGMLDQNGKLVMNPHYYRDRRIDGIMDRVHEHFTDWELYERMGNIPIKTRGLFHLYQDVLEDSENIRRGSDFLPLPNLLEYFMTGERGAERTIASVLYLLDKDGENWNYEVLRRLGIPTNVFASLLEPGVKKGTIQESFSQNHEVQGVPVITVAGHDTESALLAVPGLNESKAFVSMGTSFIFGARVNEPVVNEASFCYGFKNMRGAFGSYSLCKDVPGFWILERCMEAWRAEIPDLDYDMVCQAVSEAGENRTFLNISDDRFRVSESNILTAIENYCIDTGQEPVREWKAVARCLFESYALYIRYNLELLGSLTGKRYESLEALNGGVRNTTLLQMLADATGIPVTAQSDWASACGNLLMQLYATEVFASREDLDRAAEHSCRPVIYRSRPSSFWEERLQYMKQRQLFEGE
ncbi:MAG: rhamnulokinase [Clostridiales bacterium]|nr:rhamnulokinase [Clostridiales bacterium]